MAEVFSIDNKGVAISLTRKEALILFIITGSLWNAALARNGKNEVEMGQIYQALFPVIEEWKEKDEQL